MSSSDSLFDLSVVNVDSSIDIPYELSHLVSIYCAMMIVHWGVNCLRRVILDDIRNSDVFDN